MNDTDKLIEKHLSEDDFDIIKRMCNQGDYPRKNPAEVALWIARFLEAKANDSNTRYFISL